MKLQSLCIELPYGSINYILFDIVVITSLNIIGVFKSNKDVKEDII